MSETLKFNSDHLIERLPEPLIKNGVCREAAETLASALVRTSLRGVDSHGINLYPHYHHVSATGRINGNANIRFERETAGTALVDADHAFGHHAGMVAMTKAMELAANTGMGAVAVKNSSHFASAAFYAEAAAREGFIGFSFTNADSLVKAHNSTLPFFGTNPVCMAAPMKGEDPFCLDMATSQVSWNKIKNHRRQDVELGKGWAFDKTGTPTNDPHAAASLAPTGSYKGFGLGMMVEVLCGLLSGGPVATQLLPMYHDLSARRLTSHFFMALDIKKFTDVDNFAERLTHMAQAIRNLPQSHDADDQLMVPGDPEKRSYRYRKEHGIPVDAIKYDEFLAINPSFEDALQRTPAYAKV